MLSLQRTKINQRDIAQKLSNGEKQFLYEICCLNLIYIAIKFLHDINSLRWPTSWVYFTPSFSVQLGVNCMGNYPKTKKFTDRLHGV